MPDWLSKFKNAIKSMAVQLSRTIGIIFSKMFPHFIKLFEVRMDFRTYSYLRNRRRQGKEIRNMLVFPMSIFMYITKEKPSMVNQTLET